LRAEGGLQPARQPGRLTRRANGAQWSPHLSRLAGLIDGMKVEARTALPDFDTRRDYLESLLEGEAANAALSGAHEDALALARAALAAWPAPIQL
jgi:hypothetical protein